MAWWQGDPHNQNEKGKLFQQFLQRHPQLTVANALSICKGIITRKRNHITGNTEESVIDFIVVCSRVLPYLTEMIIDIDNKYITTNYTGSQKKPNGKTVNSDHRTIFAKMNLTTAPFKIPRGEIFNLKNLQCQSAFKENTDKSHDLRSCMELKQPLSIKIEAWEKALGSHLSKTFRRIRVRKEQGKGSASESLIDKGNKLAKLNEVESSEVVKEAHTKSLVKLDLQKAQIIMKEWLEKANKFRRFCDRSTSFPVQ